MTTTFPLSKKESEVDDREEKLSEISMCLNQLDVNLWELRELALKKGGFVNAETRRVAWCKLLGHNGDNDNVSSSSFSASDVSNASIRPSSSSSLLVPAGELNLIHQDVRRSILFHYDSNVSANSHNDGVALETSKSGESSSQHEGPYQEKLARILESVVAHPVGEEKLYYYQGLHDVAGVMMYHLDSQDVSPVLRRICAHYLRDAMRPDLKNLTWFLKTVLEPILWEVDQELCFFLTDSEVELSNAVLSWLITWFTHDIHDEQVASRLVDAFVASHPLLPMYFAIAVLIHPSNRNDILSSDPDPAMVHMTIRGLLSKISPDYYTQTEDKEVITTQDLLDDAITILKLLPPDSVMNCASAYASPNGQVDMGKAESIALLQDAPAWALASSSTGGGSDDKAPGYATYDRAKLACGVAEIMETTDCNMIVSRRLETSVAFATRSRSIHRLGVKVLCHNLKQDRRIFSISKRTNNCLVVALATIQNVHATIYCWNHDRLFVYIIRQRKGKVKVFEVCHIKSAFLGYVLGVVTFSKALLQVSISIVLHMLVLLIALLVLQYGDTGFWKLCDYVTE